MIGYMSKDCSRVTLSPSPRLLDAWHACRWRLISLQSNNLTFLSFPLQLPCEESKLPDKMNRAQRSNSDGDGSTDSEQLPSKSLKLAAYPLSPLAATD
jgi:hypothetical protein